MGSFVIEHTLRHVA